MYGSFLKAWQSFFSSTERLSVLHTSISHSLISEDGQHIRSWQKVAFRRKMFCGFRESHNLKREFAHAQKPWIKKLKKVKMGFKHLLAKNQSPQSGLKVQTVFSIILIVLGLIRLIWLFIYTLFWIISSESTGEQYVFKWNFQQSLHFIISHMNLSTCCVFFYKFCYVDVFQHFTSHTQNTCFNNSHEDGISLEVSSNEVQILCSLTWVEIIYTLPE